MMRTLLTKTLYDRRWFILGWSIGLALMVWLVLIFFPALSKDNSFEQIAATLPEQFKGLIGDAASFTQLPSYIATQLYGIRVPLFLMIMSLVLAQTLTVSEEEKGTLRTLLATPLSRGRILLEKWLAGIVIMSFALLATTAATYAGVASIDEAVPHDIIWKLALLSLCFAAAAFSLPFATALATGSRAITMVVGIAATIGSFILSSFTAMVAWLEPWDVISLLHYYDTANVAKDGLNVGHIIVLLGITVASLVGGWLLFRRRDVSGD